jgi:hypothetical protein
MDVSEDVSNAINGSYLLLGLVVVGGIVWIVYEVYENGSNLFCSIFGVNCSDASSDPTSANYVESFGSAATESIEHPIETVETILGLNQGDSSPDETTANYDVD